MEKPNDSIKRLYKIILRHIEESNKNIIKNKNQFITTYEEGKILESNFVKEWLELVYNREDLLDLPKEVKNAVS